MTVRELMALLATVDPDLPVVTVNVSHMDGDITAGEPEPHLAFVDARWGDYFRNAGAAGEVTRVVALDRPYPDNDATPLRTPRQPDL